MMEVNLLHSSRDNFKSFIKTEILGQKEIFTFVLANENDTARCVSRW